MCRRAGDFGHIYHANRVWVELCRFTASREFLSTVGMHKSSLWRNRVRIGVKRVSRHILGNGKLSKSLFYKGKFALSLFMVLLSKKSSLGITLRIK